MTKRTRTDPPPEPPPPDESGNQLVYGCFQGTHGLPPPAPWVCTSGWDVSRKDSNPCGPAGNRTAARINDPTQSGFSGPNIDERVWQVVPGLGAHLIVEGQAVHHHAVYTDINIYGGDSADGPWALVWTPFTLADADAGGRWAMPVKHTETDLPQAYAFYKFEFAAMYAVAGPSGDAGGVKFTNAYFRSS